MGGMVGERERGTVGDDHRRILEHHRPFVRVVNTLARVGRVVVGPVARHRLAEVNHGIAADDERAIRAIARNGQLCEQRRRERRQAGSESQGEFDLCFHNLILGCASLPPPIIPLPHSEQGKEMIRREGNLFRAAGGCQV